VIADDNGRNLADSPLGDPLPTRATHGLQDDADFQFRRPQFSDRVELDRLDKRIVILDRSQRRKVVGHQFRGDADDNFGRSGLPASEPRHAPISALLDDSEHPVDAS